MRIASLVRVMFATGLQKKRLAGLLLLAVLLGLFLAFNRFPKLDTVREDLEAISGPQAECFQGFCVDTGASILSRWWDFSVTYLRLVAPGMLFAFLVAGLTGAFLFPSSGTRAFSGGGVWGAFKGMMVGTPLSLCSACIVPISRALRGRGASIATTLGVVQGSATLNIPALVMVAVIFTPLLGGSRILLSLLAGLLIGPLVARMVGERNVPAPGLALAAEEEGGPASWGLALREGGWMWIQASLGYLLRLGPVMVLAGFASGLALQWVRPEVVETYLGNNIQGVALAATLGILINVPLLFEVPLVVLLLLMGMGAAPAATLLFTVAAGGPMTFWGLARALPRRAIVTFAAATWAVGLLGGLGVFTLTTLLPDAALSYRTTAVSPSQHVGANRPARVEIPMAQHAVQLTALSSQSLVSDRASSGEGRVVLNFAGLASLQQGFHYEAWALFGTGALSLGVFNVDETGMLVDLTGASIESDGFHVSASLGNATELLVTIEPPGDTDRVPADTRYLAGALVDGVADLTVVHPLALGNSFRRAKAYYILSSPSSNGPEDWKSGVWWLDLTGFSTLEGEPGFHLPELPPGWVYEGWVQIQGKPFTTGRFYNVVGNDFDSPYNGPLPVPGLPGEDYILNAPPGYRFPTDIRGEPIFLSIEPYPDDSLDPFSLVPLLGTIPREGGYRITYKLENVARDFPVGRAEVR